MFKYISSLTLRLKELFLVSCYSGSGTLRPDLIESASCLASGKADAIKTHHNDTDLVRELREQVSSDRQTLRKRKEKRERRKMWEVQVFFRKHRNQKLEITSFQSQFSH